MSDIIGAISKMLTQEIAANKPTTEALFSKFGANINWLIDNKIRFQEFTSSGTWIAPEAEDLVVEMAIVIGCGGGGGGGGGEGRAGTGVGQRMRLL